MKKLTVFLMLLMCVSFAEMSAQTIRWEVIGNATLQILVDDVEQFNSPKTSGTGFLSVPAGSIVKIYAWSPSLIGSYPLDPIITEDDPYMIENAASSDYNFTNEEHTALYEYFTMPPVDMYIEMKS